jgi:hypothetical protein
MASRRQVIQGLGVIAGASAFAGLAEATEAAKPTKIHRFIIDERFPESRVVSHQYVLRRVPTSSVKGDVTDLWFHDLSRLWKQGPAAIAGVTGADVLWVLERLAWDSGLRVTSRKETAQKSGAVAWVIGPAPTRRK